MKSLKFIALFIIGAGLFEVAIAGVQIETRLGYSEYSYFFTLSYQITLYKLPSLYNT